MLIATKRGAGYDGHWNNFSGDRAGTKNAATASGRAKAMSTDWREKEREFLSGLKPDTGRDLGEWMRVIAAQNLPHRNDIIDWLRQQGFTFARASWLERIHHNAGQPIYLDGNWQQQQDAQAEAENMAAEPRLAVAAGGGRVMIAGAAPSLAPAGKPPQPLAPTAKMPTPAPVLTPVAAPAAEVQQASSSATAPQDTGRSDTAMVPPPAERCSPPSPLAAPRSEIDEVLAKGKAYRPLAAVVLRAVETAVPATITSAGPSHLSFYYEGRIFGLLAVSGKDLRLALAPVDAPEGGGLQPAKLPVTLAKFAQGLPRMIVLTDARQVDDGFVNLIRLAARV